jgi:hypothetical protein
MKQTREYKILVRGNFKRELKEKTQEDLNVGRLTFIDIISQFDNVTNSLRPCPRAS